MEILEGSDAPVLPYSVQEEGEYAVHSPGLTDTGYRRPAPSLTLSVMLQSLWDLAESGLQLIPCLCFTSSPASCCAPLPHGSSPEMIPPQSHENLHLRLCSWGATSSDMTDVKDLNHILMAVSGGALGCPWSSLGRTGEHLHISPHQVPFVPRMFTILFTKERSGCCPMLHGPDEEG